MAPKTKKTFVAHAPSTLKVLGSYTGSIPSQAARKAVSAGHKEFVLRESGEHTKGKLFKGEVKKLSTPKIVTIKGKEIKYDKMPVVKYVKMVDLKNKKMDEAA